MYSPTDCIVNWTTDPSKGQRLMDWLEAHKAERDILFSSRRDREDGSGLTKQACGTRAAVAVFACDANATLRQRVAEDPKHFGKIVTDHIRNRLKKKYRTFNSKIGSKASNSRYKDLRVEGSLHKKIGKLMADEFPEWSRLHVYWRTNPYFNQYCNTPSSTSDKGGASHKRSPAKTATQPHTLHSGSTTRAGKLAVASENNPRDKIIVVEDTPSPGISFQDSDNDEKAPLQPAATKTAGKSKTEAHRRKRTRPEYDSDYDTVDGGLTTAQRHELRMAEVQLKRQKLELECQEKKNAAEIQRAQLEAEASRQREKHEIMMQLMAFVTGGAGREATAEHPEKV